MVKKYSFNSLCSNIIYDLDMIENIDDKIRLLKIKFKKIIQIKECSDTKLIDD